MAFMTTLLLASASQAVPIHLISQRDWESWSAARPDFVRALARMQDFKGQAGRSLIVPSTDGACERVLFGLGDEPTPLLVGALARDLPTGDYRIASGLDGLDPTLTALGWALGGYAFERYKPRAKAPPRLVAPEGCDIAEAEALAAAHAKVRDLVNTPAGDLGPEALHAEAEAIAAAFGAEIEAHVGPALLEKRFPLIHAVGRAAAEAPRVVRLSWGSPGAPKLALVGKGVCFDTGGLDLKLSGGMRLMKKDMGGAAHALGLGQLLMQRGAPVRLEITLAIVENAVGAGAMRPGDVIKSRKGLTVEIDNTDAEGRLILADALTWAGESAPDLTLDFATLTGAARVALGPEIVPFFTEDETLAQGLAAASAAMADPLWRLPLWKPYDADMDSAIANLKNTGDGANAGAIYGALFLRRFAPPRWAHFDIYAWTPKERPARPAGGEAQALRACYRMLQGRFRFGAGAPR
jgi:leucyl aminopeptidase